MKPRTAPGHVAQQVGRAEARAMRGFQLVAELDSPGHPKHVEP